MIEFLVGTNPDVHEAVLWSLLALLVFLISYTVIWMISDHD
jgi:hypothetical protein